MSWQQTLKYWGRLERDCMDDMSGVGLRDVE